MSVKPPALRSGGAREGSNNIPSWGLSTKSERGEA